MNDFEAPKLCDTDPPRVFNTVTSSKVQYNMDFVEYLMTQEADRRSKARLPELTFDELGDFRRQLVALVIIQGNAEAAIALRPSYLQHIPRQQLNG